MNRFFCLILILTLLPVAVRAQSTLPPVGEDWEQQYANGIAAVVNEQIITVDQLRDELRPLVSRIRNTSLTREEFDSRLEEVSYDVLRNLIDRVLIVEDFRDKGMAIPKVYIEKEYDDYITEQFGGDRVAFHHWLRQEGKTPRHFRDELRDKMVVDYMRSQMRKSQSAVSPVRIQEYYENNKHLFFDKERIHLYQITLAPITNEPPALLMQEAQTILSELRAGASFEDLARKHSQDDKKKKGGDWGWIERDDLAPELAQVAFSVPEGGYSQPVEKSGYVFIFHVKDKRSEGAQPLSKVKSEIENALAAELARKAQKVWLDRLRQNAYIRYYL